jgi:hypothetical protein
VIEEESRFDSGSAARGRPPNGRGFRPAIRPTTVRSAGNRQGGVARPTSWPLAETRAVGRADLAEARGARRAARRPGLRRVSL